MSEPVELTMSVARASDELARLRLLRPDDDAPVRAWVPWLEQQADLWDVIVAADGVSAGNARWVADYLRRLIKDLRENFKPGDRWPGASAW
jgi:hypothetical protein